MEQERNNCTQESEVLLKTHTMKSNSLENDIRVKERPQNHAIFRIPLDYPGPTVIDLDENNNQSESRKFFSKALKRSLLTFFFQRGSGSSPVGGGR